MNVAVRLLASLLFGAAFSPLATASPVVFSEAVSGDLVYGGRGDVPTLFSFDAGVNTVSGTVTSSFSLPTDFDGFQFRLGSTLRLDSVSVSFDFTPTSNGTLVKGAGTCTDFDIIGASSRLLLAANRAAINYPNTCAEAVAPAVSSGGPLWSSLLPLSDAVWEVTPAMATNDGGGGRLNYRFTFNVSNTNSSPGTGVPEPGTLVMTLAGLGAAGLVGGRRKTQRAPAMAA